MKNPMFGKGFAKAMAAAAGAGAAGIAAAASAGVAGEGRPGVNSVYITSSGGGDDGKASVSVTGINAVPGKVSGVTIIDGKLWIDGEAIPEGVTAYTAASGRKYTISRENGQVNVRGE